MNPLITVFLAVLIVWPVESFSRQKLWSRYLRCRQSVKENMYDSQYSKRYSVTECINELADLNTDVKPLQLVRQLITSPLKIPRLLKKRLGNDLFDGRFTVSQVIVNLESAVESENPSVYSACIQLESLRKRLCDGAGQCLDSSSRDYDALYALAYSLYQLALGSESAIDPDLTELDKDLNKIEGPLPPSTNFLKFDRDQLCGLKEAADTVDVPVEQSNNDLVRNFKNDEEIVDTRKSIEVSQGNPVEEKTDSTTNYPEESTVSLDLLTTTEELPEETVTTTVTPTTQVTELTTEDSSNSTTEVSTTEKPTTTTKATTPVKTVSTRRDINMFTKTTNETTTTRGKTKEEIAEKPKTDRQQTTADKPLATSTTSGPKEKVSRVRAEEFISESPFINKLLDSVGKSHGPLLH